MACNPLGETFLHKQGCRIKDIGICSHVFQYLKVRVGEGGGGGHIIILRERERGGGEVRANLDAAGGGTYLIFPLVKLILGPLLPDNYCTVPK